MVPYKGHKCPSSLSTLLLQCWLPFLEIILMIHNGAGDSYSNKPQWVSILKNYHAEVKYLLNPKSDDSYYDSEWQKFKKEFVKRGTPIMWGKKKGGKQ